MVLGLFLDHLHLELAMFASARLVWWLGLSALPNTNMSPGKFHRLQYQVTIWAVG